MLIPSRVSAWVSTSDETWEPWALGFVNATVFSVIQIQIIMCWEKAVQTDNHSNYAWHISCRHKSIDWNCALTLRTLGDMLVHKAIPSEWVITKRSSGFIELNLLPVLTLITYSHARSQSFMYGKRKIFCFAKMRWFDLFFSSSTR